MILTPPTFFCSFSVHHMPICGNDHIFRLVWLEHIKKNFFQKRLLKKWLFFFRKIDFWVTYFSKKKNPSWTDVALVLNSESQKFVKKNVLNFGCEHLQKNRVIWGGICVPTGSAGALYRHFLGGTVCYHKTLMKIFFEKKKNFSRLHFRKLPFFKKVEKKFFEIDFWVTKKFENFFWRWGSCRALKVRKSGLN